MYLRTRKGPPSARAANNAGRIIIIIIITTRDGAQRVSDTSAEPAASRRHRRTMRGRIDGSRGRGSAGTMDAPVVVAAPAESDGSGRSSGESGGARFSGNSIFAAGFRSKGVRYTDGRCRVKSVRRFYRRTNVDKPPSAVVIVTIRARKLLRSRVFFFLFLRPLRLSPSEPEIRSRTQRKRCLKFLVHIIRGMTIK